MLCQSKHSVAHLLLFNSMVVFYTNSGDISHIHFPSTLSIKYILWHIHSIVTNQNGTRLRLGYKKFTLLYSYSIIAFD